MKINHFPNISLDISETKEKYLTEKMRGSSKNYAKF